MPKETFLKLNEEKRKRFIEEALREFSLYNFETASINTIIKNIGIARGSVYQYFDDKLDLWLYLKEYAEQIKISYVKSLNRNDFTTFWDYYKAMYVKGIDFDIEQPLCSKFLYRIGFKENSEEVVPYINSWKNKANEMFTYWVEVEKKQDTFSKSISTEIIVHFLITMSMSIADLLQSKYQVNFEQNIKQGKPLFAKNKKELLSAVNELIVLLEKSLT